MKILSCYAVAGRVAISRWVIYLVLFRRFGLSLGSNVDELAEIRY